MKRIVLISCGLIAIIGVAVLLPVAGRLKQEREIKTKQLIAEEKSRNVGLDPCGETEPAVRHYTELMLKNSPKPSIVSIRIAPSFTPEKAISIGNSGIYRVQMDATRTAEYPEPKIHDEKFSPIDKKLIRRLASAVSHEIDHADSPYFGGLDGTAYFFLDGKYCGHAWSPHGMTRAARLVDLVNILEQPAPDAESVERAIISIENGSIK